MIGKDRLFNCSNKLLKFNTKNFPADRYLSQPESLSLLYLCFTNLVVVDSDPLVSLRI